MGPKKAGKGVAKKPGKGGGKKPGKAGGKKKPGFKLPTIIRTRQKILGARQKVKRRVKKPGRKKQPKEVEPEKPEEVIVELFDAPRKIGPRDVVIMCLLWSYEVVQKYARAYKGSWLASQQYFISSRLSNDIELTTPDSVAVVMATVGAAMGVGWLADGYRMRSIPKDTMEPNIQLDRKWWIMQVGFVFYLVTPFVGLMLVRESSSDVNVALVAFQVGWYAVNPIRFWFIFHQIFPVSVFYTRIITACNLFVIGLAEYMLTIFVELRAQGSLALVIAWTALFLLMIFWMVALIFMLKRINKAPDDLTAVRKIYSGTEAIDNFDGRQSRINYFCIVSLIYPSIMMGASREFINSAMIRYYSTDGLKSAFRYRLHLGVSLATIPVVTGILFLLNFFRDENRNVFVIGIAHFFNFIFLSLMTITVVWDLNSVAAREPVLLSGETGVTMVMVPKADVGPEEFIIARPYFEATIEKRASSMIPNALYECPMLEESFTTIAVGKRNDATLFTGSITFMADKVLAYVEREGRLKLLLDSGQPLMVDRVRYSEKGLPSVYQLTLFTSEPPCVGGPKRDAKGARIFIDGRCSSFKALVRFYDRNGNLLTDHWLIPTAGYDTVQPDSVEVSRTSLHSVSVLYVLDDREDLSFESTEVIDPFTYQRYYLVFPKQRSVEAYSLKNLETRVPTTPRTNLSKTDATTNLTVAAAQPEIRARIGHFPANCSMNQLPPWALPPYDTEMPAYKNYFDRKPQPPVEEILLLPASILHGLAFGALLVCYIHFLWIRSPFRFRTPILACYFSLDFLGGWMVRNLIVAFDRAAIYTLISVQGAALNWHIAWAYVHHWTLTPISPTELQGNDREF